MADIKIVKELFIALDDEVAHQIYVYRYHNGDYPKQASLDILEKTSGLLNLDSRALNKLDKIKK